MKKIFIVPLMAPIVLNACNLDNVNRSKKIDYKSSKVEKPLSFPPNLSTENIENLYNIPNTYSDYSNTRGNRQQDNASSGVLPTYGNIRFVRSGSQRWLESSNSPGELWPKVKNFFEETGLSIKSERPRAGVMETEWAENRAEIPAGFIRGVFSRVVGSLYSSGTMDKFYIRFERSPFKKTEIFVNHQRMVEKVDGGGDTFRWVLGKPMPDLEAEILARLMVYLGANESQANVARKSYRASYDRAKLSVNSQGVASVVLMDAFPNAWRRTGNALNRAGFLIENINRSVGIYYVNYNDPVDDIRNSFVGRFLGRKEKKQSKYMVRVLQASRTSSVISILYRNMTVANNKTSQRIAKILYQQLR